MKYKSYDNGDLKALTSKTKGGINLDNIKTLSTDEKKKFFSHFVEACLIF
jgi:hypothetical protein